MGSVRPLPPKVYLGPFVMQIEWHAPRHASRGGPSQAVWPTHVSFGCCVDFAGMQCIRPDGDVLRAWEVFRSGLEDGEYGYLRQQQAQDIEVGPFP
eukprot:25410-Eustigmatos_ZCMA.PRE.1